jgi:type I restriction enzyme R subunit
MANQTTERAFETYVEEILLTRGGWMSGSNAEWDKERALFPTQVFAFIANTQPKLWAEMQTLHAAGLEALLLNSLVKELEAKGSLHVLRHGFKFYGKTFRLAYFKPAHGANYEVLELFGKNRLTVTRQVPCHPGDNRTLDMVLAVNGLPVATVELKNPGTGQNWRHAVRQYKEDRDPRAPLSALFHRVMVSAGVVEERGHEKKGAGRDGKREQSSVSSLANLEARSTLTQIVVAMRLLSVPVLRLRRKPSGS